MIFRKSLHKELFATATIAFIALFFIVLAQQIAYYVGIASKGRVASDAITTLLGFGMLRLLPMILSLSLFLTVLLTLTRWHRDSEMVIWFSSGLGIAAWIQPIMRFALPIVALIAILSLFITPWATHKSIDFRDQLKSRDELSTISPGVFKESTQTNRVFFIESFDQLGNVVKNVFVQSEQHGKLAVVVASRGHRETHANGDSFLVMEKGRRYEGKPDTPEITNTLFEQYGVRIDPIIVKQQTESIQAKKSMELIAQHSPENIAEIQWRLAVPISAMILSLIAIPLSFVDVRSGRSANFMMAILVYIIYNNLLSIFQAWLAQGKINGIIGLWPVHILFLMMTAYLLYRRLFLFPVIPQWRK